MVPLLLLRLKRRSKSQAHIPLAIFASSAILAYSWSRAISHEHRGDISTPVSTPCSHWCPGAQWISFSHYWQHISHPVEASRWRQVDDQPKWKSGEQHFVMPSNWSFNNRSSWSALKANEQKKSLPNGNNESGKNDFSWKEKKAPLIGMFLRRRPLVKDDTAAAVYRKEL